MRLSLDTVTLLSRLMIAQLENIIFRHCFNLQARVRDISKYTIIKIQSGASYRYRERCGRCGGARYLIGLWRFRVGGVVVGRARLCFLPFPKQT